MRALTPLTGFKQEMDRLFDRMLEPRWDMFESAGDWAPKLDMSETKDALVIKAEIPGVDEKDIAVSLQEGVLTIKGEKRQEKEEKDERAHRIERSYGAFMRAVTLPATVEADKVSATFTHGVLTVALPKAPASKATTIPVKAA